VREPRGVTIQDVAKAAGVSSTSVSNYLNDRMGEMRLETRERIARAIRDLGYMPNSAARQLKTGHAPMLGLLVPTVVNPYYGELAVAVDAAAQKKGFRVILCNTQRDPDREMAFVRELVSYGVRGILAASVLQNVSAMSALIRRGVAFVLFETLGPDPGVDRVDIVSINHVLAAERVVDCLVTQGHKSIVFVTATPLTPHRLTRLRGFRNAMQRNGLGDGVVVTDEDVPVQATSHNDADLAQFGHLAAAHVMSMQPRPTAIFAMNDFLAIGMLSGFHKLGVKVPGDISIVGVDDIQLASFTSPSLTTVRQPFSQIAESAIDSICARLANPARAGSATYLEPTLVMRASTAPI